MGVNAGAMCSAKGVLRLFELLFSIICFALVADYDSFHATYRFTLFTGITTMIFCVIFLMLYVLEFGDSSFLTITEAVFDPLWWLFWLATAAALTDLDFKNSKVEASTAFAWLTLFLFCATAFMSVRKALAGRRSAGPPVPSPEVAVAMA